MTLGLSRLTAGLFGAASLLAAPARAELGGTVSSVHADGGRMGSRVMSTVMGGYTRHDLTRANGGVVHELTNAQGQVFAVTWSGPGKPDLRSLLGRYFDGFQTSASGFSGRMIRGFGRAPQVGPTDLQVQTGGHMGFFHGAAVVPSLAPAGFSAADLPQER